MLPRSFRHWFASLIIAAPLLSALPALGQMDLPSARKPVVKPTPISFGSPMEVMDSPDFATFELSLSQLVGNSAPVNLTGSSDTLTIPLPVPGLWKPENVSFLLNIIPSAALAKGSSLVVSVNGTVVHQQPLHQDKDAQALNIDMPVKLLKSGTNLVVLQVTHREKAPVDGATPAQLWSQVSLTESKFTLSASRQLIAPNLSNLDDLFDRAGWSGKSQVTVFTAKELAEDRLQALGLVAQGIGHRQGTVPVVISHQQLPTDMDGLVAAMPEGSIATLVLGSFEEIAALNPDLIFPQDNGPVISMARLPGEVARYGIFLVGANDGELVRAAKAFATQGIPWPQREWVAITHADITAPSTELSSEDGTLPLRSWGYSTTTFSSLETDGVELNIWQNDTTTPVKLLLNLSYSRGLSADSSLAVLVDNQLEAQVALDNPNGSIRELQRVIIPAEALLPGWNTLKLKPMLHTQNGEKDSPAVFSLTLYDDSAVEIADQTTPTDLATISGQGPLFSSAPLGRDLAFNLASADSDTLSAGLTLVAKMAQLYQGALLDSRFGVGPAVGANRHFWLGSWDKLPDDVKPENFTPTSAAFAVPVEDSPSASANLGLKLTGGLDNRSVAISTADGDNEPAIVFAAPNTAQLREGLASVVDRELWGQLGGVAAYWSPDSQKLEVIGAVTASNDTVAQQSRWSGRWGSVLLPLLAVVLVALILGTLRSRRTAGQGE